MPNPNNINTLLPSPATEGAGSSSITTAAVAVNGADEKPRLTEEEKKQNHIASGASLPPPCLRLLQLLCRVLSSFLLPPCHCVFGAC